MMAEQPRAKDHDETPKDFAATARALEMLNSLGMDDDRNLLWKGKRVRIQQRLTLSFWQALATIVVALGAAAQGAAALVQLGAWLGWWKLHT